MAKLKNKIVSFLLAISIFTSCNVISIVRPLVFTSIAMVTIEKDACATTSNLYVDRSDKSKWIAIFLALFVGFHHFYLKNNMTAIVYIIFTVLYGVGEILSLIDLLIMLNMSDQEWQNYLQSNRSLLW
jgi:TM2 domain-containing membrane protein YozV